MPNWCECRVEFDGAAEEIERLFDFVGLTGEPPEFSFNRIIPYPDEFAERDRAYDAVRPHADPDTARAVFVARYGTFTSGFGVGGYEWCCANWGTKWPAQSVDLIDGAVVFDTAWEPPLPIIRRLMQLFPSVVIDLTYREEGAGFEGGLCGSGDKGASEWRGHFEFDQEEADGED